MMGGYKRSKLKKILQTPTERIRYNVVDSLIPDELRGGRILDIGCGEYPYFLERIKFREKVGIDPVSEFLPKENKGTTSIIYKDKVPDVWWSWMPNRFDVITIISVIEHLNPEDVPIIFNEIYRILKPGGRFIMTCLNPKADWFLHLIGWDIEHQKYYSIATIREMLQYAEFNRIHSGIFEYGLNHWLYVDKKKEWIKGGNNERNNRS